MPRLSIIIPTYNESANIPILIERIGDVLSSTDYEIIVVDDNSPDRTYEIVQNIGKTNPRVRCIRRLHERGLSSAVVTGMAASEADYFAVMDADLQHDERILPQLLDAVASGSCDLAVGSRAVEDGSFGEFSFVRKMMSHAATLAAKILLRVSVSDPMSGYFLLSRKVFEKAEHIINPLGFKILLEFLGRLPDLKVREVGYTFRNRIHGETKLSGSVIRNYLVALLDLRFGSIVSPIFLLYCGVGASGILVYYAAAQITSLTGMPPVPTGFDAPFDTIRSAAVIGFIASVVNNYIWNNFITFYDRRHKSLRIVPGVLVFTAVSLVGLLVTVGVANLVLSLKLGFVTPPQARGLGIIVAVITNYFLNAGITWPAKKR